jgi:apolipoprotein N-acyltransferase
VAELAPHTRGVLRGDVEGRVGNTPFAAWAGRFGLWPLLALALLGTVIAGRWRRVGGSFEASPGP